MDEISSFYNHFEKREKINIKSTSASAKCKFKMQDQFILSSQRLNSLKNEPGLKWTKSRVFLGKKRKKFLKNKIQGTSASAKCKFKM